MKNMRTHGHWYEKNSGFTILELLVVVAIVGFAVALAGPGLIRMNEQASADAEAQSVRGFVHKCRGLAVERGHTSSRPSVLHFESDRVSCVVWVDNGDQVFDGGTEVAETLSERELEHNQIDLAKSVLPDDQALLITSGGYFLAATRATLVAQVWLSNDGAQPTAFSIYPSGQLEAGND